MQVGPVSPKDPCKRETGGHSRRCDNGGKRLECHKEGATSQGT